MVGLQELVPKQNLKDTIDVASTASILEMFKQSKRAISFPSYHGVPAVPRTLQMITRRHVSRSLATALNTITYTCDATETLCRNEFNGARASVYLL